MPKPAIIRVNIIGSGAAAIETLAALASTSLVNVKLPVRNVGATVVPVKSG